MNDRTIKVFSWGVKRGKLPDYHRAFDCRSIRNPHHELHLKDRTGLDKTVQNYVMADPEFANVLIKAGDAVRGGASVIAFFCTGGRHRSVVAAKTFGEQLTAMGFKVTVEHPCLENEKV